MGHSYSTSLAGTFFPRNHLRGQYQELQLNENGWLWSQQLELYLGIHQSQLRFFTATGELVPTPEETAEQERQRADRLAQRLREMGIDPSE